MGLEVLDSAVISMQANNGIWYEKMWSYFLLEMASEIWISHTFSSGLLEFHEKSQNHSKPDLDLVQMLRWRGG